MPRYEFTKGTSSKFWQIELSGTSYTTTYGKIGTDGKSTSKDFPDEAKAKKEYEKAIGSKTKKGYALVGGDATGDAAPAPGAPVLDLAGLEKEISTGENAKRLVHRTIVDFKTKTGLSQAAKGLAYRVHWDYDDEETFEAMLAALLNDERAAKLEALVFGCWEEEMGAGGTSQGSIDQLIQGADKLPNLRALFLGDLTGEQCEMSWIEQGDFAPLLAAFPKLEHLRVRGVRQCGALQSDSLRSLVLQCGLPTAAAQQVAAAQLPALEHLELWCGTDEYAGDVTVDDLMPILSGKLFPKLSYLGLRNAQIADALAAAVATSPIVQRLHTLDMSLGTLSDVGFGALAASQTIASLQRLDLHHHYAGKKAVAQVKKLGVPILDVKQGDIEEDEDDGDVYRYVAVGE